MSTERTLLERIEQTYHRLILIRSAAKHGGRDEYPLFDHARLFEAIAELACEAADDLAPLTRGLPDNVSDYDPDEDGEPKKELTAKGGAR